MIGVELLDFVAALGEARARRDVWRAWSGLMEGFGFTASFFGHVRRAPGSGGLELDGIENNWRPGATAEYTGKGFYRVDPLVRAALTETRPFYHDVRGFRTVPMPKPVRALFEMDIVQDLPAKVAAPVHAGGGGVWIFNGAGDHRPTELSEFRARRLDGLQLAAHAAESRLRALSADDAAGAPLTRRERECLYGWGGACATTASPCGWACATSPSRCIWRTPGASWAPRRASRRWSRPSAAG